MKNKQIFFTGVHNARLLENEVSDPAENEVLVKTEYTVVSGGTERACIMGMNNTSQKFPMSLGYSGVGIVEKAGKNVTNVGKGDRVLVYHGCHSLYNIRPESDITKVENGKISSLEAAFVIIASMGLGGVRKLEVELGESAMVMGQGLLGCTRVSDSSVDYYQQVHKPGIKLIGAHNFVRPKYESYPHHWTHRDDCNAIIDLITAKKLQVEPIVSRIETPENAPAVYNELCDCPGFPIGTVFDWRSV